MKLLLLPILALLTAFVCLFLAPSNTLKTSEFTLYKAQWNKSYPNKEIEAFRMQIFYENVAKIERHNANPDKTYTEGINQFTDLTQEEFISTYLGELSVAEYVEPEEEYPSNAEIDWGKKGAVTEVKNQGSCGSCYAFSAVGHLESWNLLFGSKQKTLYSEQQIVDCSSSYGNSGCNGGLRDNCLRYTRDKGLVTESEYPYVAREQTCKTPSGGSFKIKNFTNATSCDSLEKALEREPISVGVDAGRWGSYSRGIFDNCGTGINHGVLLTGVSSTGGYWLIKNSWGTSWGESGYIKLKYPGSTCAVCNRAWYVTD